MAQEVMIKSTKYGIHLILNPEIPFGELLHAVSEKFEEAAKFFGKAKLAISFEGRDLSQGESFRIIESITAHTDVSIICIVDDEPLHAELFKEQIDTYYNAIEGKEGTFYRGNLRAGQTIESDETIVLIGDVCPGASVVSERNIVILGALQGSAHAGVAGDETCFVTALEMAPEKLKIGSLIAFTPEKKTKAKKQWFKEKAPVLASAQIAVADGRNISVKTIEKGILV